MTRIEIIRLIEMIERRPASKFADITQSRRETVDELRDLLRERNERYEHMCIRYGNFIAMHAQAAARGDEVTCRRIFRACCRLANAINADAIWGQGQQVI